MPEYHLDFVNNRDECGPTLVSVLAHPNDAVTKEARLNLHATLCTLCFRSRAEVDENWAVIPQPIKPIHAFRNPKDIDRDLRKLKRLLRDRMVAAKMAMAFLQDIQLGLLPKLPKGMKRLSVNELTILVMEDAMQEEPNNIESRIWRPSLPVIHLATATALVIDQLESNGFSNFSIGHLLINPDIVKRIIEISNEHADMLLTSNKISLKPDSLIRIYSQQSS